MSRFEKLLSEVAMQFENGSCPMNHDWLCLNNVTSTECGELMDKIGLVLKGYLNMSKRERLRVEVAGAASDSSEAATLVAVMDRQEVLRKIKAL